MAMNREEYFKVCQTLEDFAQAEGTELGEYCNELCSLYNYSYMMGGTVFQEELSKEILKQLKYFEDNFKITTKDETFTRCIITLEEIEENNT